MKQRYEYKFVRVRKGAQEDEYQQIVSEYADKGWRLVQILAPGAGGLWASPTSSKWFWSVSWRTEFIPIRSSAGSDSNCVDVRGGVSVSSRPANTMLVGSECPIAD